MGDYVPKEKNKHLTLSNRIDLENSLNRNLKLKEAAAYVGCDDRTASKEIRRNRVLVETREPNKCSLKTVCHKHLVCGGNGHCGDECRRCKERNCNDSCPDFRAEPSCARVTKYPFVCNGCPTRNTCRLCKFFYSAKQAQESYEGKLSLCRSHVHYTDDEVKAIDAVVSPLILKGYSPEVILIEKGGELPPMSVATLYKLIDLRLLSVRNIDLKRKVRRAFKASRSAKRERPDPKCKEGRCYEDFLEYVGANPSLGVWELDTVEGRKGGKALMTLLERRSNFMLVFLVRKICKDEIARVFALIRRRLGAERFASTFPVILTDNGSEFLGPDDIELDPETGEKLCRLYYCEARHSEQKGKIEKNHEHLREILPKGTDFDFLDDEAVFLVSNNVNNYTRPQFRASPLAMVRPYMDKRVLGLNKLKPIKQVNLKPDLLQGFRDKR